MNGKETYIAAEKDLIVSLIHHGHDHDRVCPGMRLIVQSNTTPIVNSVRVQLAKYLRSRAGGPPCEVCPRQ